MRAYDDLDGSGFFNAADRVGWTHQPEAFDQQQSR
jgi:hypothetical protein